MNTPHSLSLTDTVDAPQGLANFHVAEAAIERFRALCADGADPDEAQRGAAVDTTMARTPAPEDRPGAIVSDVSPDAATITDHQPGTTWEPGPAEPWTPGQRHAVEEPLADDDRVSLTDTGRDALDRAGADADSAEAGSAEAGSVEMTRRIDTALTRAQEAMARTEADLAAEPGADEPAAGYTEPDAAASGELEVSR